MSRRLRSAAWIGLALSGVAAMILGPESRDLVEVALWSAPVLGLAFSLLVGHYAGETLIEACRERRRPSRRRVALVAQRVPRGAARSRISGGRLLAHAVAQRGPPAARAICS